MWKVIKSHIPNTITCCNLLSGCIAVVLAFRSPEQMGCLHAWQWAFLFIGAAALFDFMDGASARLLKAYSNVGKELDSLADLVSFGVAPAMLLYNTWSELMPGTWWPWVALLMAPMGALRLARFNVDDRQATTFIGLPIPANAIFWIGYIDAMRGGYIGGNITTAIITVIVSLLMVSDIKMFSLKFKNFNWRENFRRYVILAGAVLFVLLNGVAGLAWTIVAYVLISAVTRKVNPSTF